MQCTLEKSIITHFVRLLPPPTTKIRHINGLAVSTALTKYRCIQYAQHTTFHVHVHKAKIKFHFAFRPQKNQQLKQQMDMDMDMVNQRIKMFYIMYTKQRIINKKFDCDVFLHAICSVLPRKNVGTASENIFLLSTHR